MTSTGRLSEMKLSVEAQTGLALFLSYSLYENIVAHLTISFLLITSERMNKVQAIR